MIEMFAGFTYTHNTSGTLKITKRANIHTQIDDNKSFHDLCIVIASNLIWTIQLAFTFEICFSFLKQSQRVEMHNWKSSKKIY